jgi:N-acetylglutamate synthase-like GNAT family acetyltransferase
MPALLRPAVSEDWPAIAALLTRHDLPLDGAADHLAHFVVAEGAEGITGVAGLEVYGEAGLLRSVAVAAPGQGLGTRLVEHIIDRATAAGVRRLLLLTTTAGEFFPRFGFRPLPRDAVPAVLQASQEFRGACPSSAMVMQRTLVTKN